MKSKKNTLKKINRTANIVLLTFIFVMAFNIMSGALIANGEAINTYDTITVEAGDTLWSIAKSAMTENDDIREVIFDIQQLNNMESDTIKPGQLIKVPVL